jgi:hypothetical protein
MLECHCGRPSCDACIDHELVAAVLGNEYRALQQEARLPTPEIVWWRAQMRARADAARRAARPILMTQAIAAAALLGVILALAGRIAAWLPFAGWDPAMELTDLRAAPLFPVLVAACGWIVIAPIVAYLALRRSGE